MATLKQRMGALLAKMRANQDAGEAEVVRLESDEAPKREVTIAQLKQGYGEVVETMQAVRTHLDDQATRSAEMMETMRGLPEVLRTIPEATRVQTQLLKAIQSHLESQNTTNGHLTDAINGMARSAREQDETLADIREHLGAEAGTRRELHTGIVALHSTMESVESSNLAARDALSEAQSQAQRAEERMAEMYRRGQRTNAIMLLISALLAAGAVGAAVYLVVWGPASG